MPWSEINHITVRRNGEELKIGSPKNGRGLVRSLVSGLCHSGWGRVKVRGKGITGVRE